jgi:hypothetical protein
MKRIGEIDESEKKIDMSHPWMVTYLQNNGTAQRRHISAPASERRPPAPSAPPADEPDNIPDIAELNHLEQLEKVRKLQLDNAIKSKTVVSKKYVQAMIDCQDESHNNIIVSALNSGARRSVKYCHRSSLA